MRAIGYSYLNKHYNLLLPKLNVEVYQDPKAEVESTIKYGASKRKIIPGNRKIKDTPYDNMVAAIKYQGIRLHFFAAIFKKVDVVGFTKFIQHKPNSIYNRVLWYLYEWLTEKTLELKDLTSGNYINLFDEKFYYTLQAGDRNKRTRVINNAIGTKEFCPTIRKTSAILDLAKKDVYEMANSKMQDLGEHLSVDVIGRSINYLYTKETKSSTEIENESSSNQKTKRFLNTIKNAGLFELTKEKIIDIQNQIVEETKKTDDYRKEEIYVGSTIQRLGGIDQDVHYIGPLAKHVPSMMQGLLDTHDKLMIDASVPPLMHATLISFGEVYIHPLIDGNGRTHRYLIHDVMKQRESEHKFIIPISSAILKNQAKYDNVLELISRPIMAMLDWELDNEHKVIINNDIDYMYRYPDYTEHVKFIYEMMNTAITKDLFEEICLLLAFDLVKSYINDCCDIPNNTLDTIVSIIMQGGGTVSNKKRKYILKYIEQDRVQSIEVYAKSTINEIKERFEVDVAKAMNNNL
ncbi:Fic family protein [Spartinivicinus ruber]|uniref:Fic family protein n=1 Tax=Spartinivicinus ruber TaxID=2683272 RepID=UPI0013D8D9E2|nr:Fic family protein [Spartinivicinus ruber]